MNNGTTTETGTEPVIRGRSAPSLREIAAIQRVLGNSEMADILEGAAFEIELLTGMFVKEPVAVSVPENIT